MALLEVNQLTKNFGGLAAVSNVSLKLEEQELVGLIGPNRRLRANRRDCHLIHC